MRSLDRSAIDADADRVVRRLAKAGFKAYLVGGCVRDILVGRRPKDFDVATSATPNEIRNVFRNCRIIGRRFRLAHVFFGDKIIETATFRANPREEEEDAGNDLLIRRDNVFGEEDEDARRRDFTINGLFYDVEKEEVIDHVDGLVDLDARLVRTIGDPDVRFQEDPIRMLRAIKFAARLDFIIEPATHRALLSWRGEIRKAAPPRVVEEVYRLLRGGAAKRSMELLATTGVLPILSPHLSTLFEGADTESTIDDVSDRDAPHSVLTASVAERAKQPGHLTGTLDADVPVLELDEEEQRWHRLWADEPVTTRRAAAPPLPKRRVLRDGEHDAFAANRADGWAVLAQLDHAIGAGVVPGNALLIAAVVSPFIVDQLVAARPAEINGLITDIVDPLIDELRVPRRDSERLRQLLLAQRRLRAAQSRGGRVELLGGPEFAQEAQILFALLQRARGLAVPSLASRQTELNLEGHDGEALGTDIADDADVLPGEDVEGADGDDRKRRRRRRGGRRQRHDVPLAR